jgi:hypothetical protein
MVRLQEPAENETINWAEMRNIENIRQEMRELRAVADTLIYADRPLPRPVRRESFEYVDALLVDRFLKLKNFAR